MTSGEGERGTARVADEAAAIDALVAELPPAPPGEVWIGDDAAVLQVAPGPLLFATDLVAEGVHFDLRLSRLADVGWKVLAVNLSDLAAMGGRPLRALVSVAGVFGDALEALYDGLGEAAARFDCPIAGGDLSEAPVGGGLVCSVAVLGTTDGRAPVLRSGARPGDELYVTGPLGSAAAGLRLLRRDPGASGPEVDAHRRPVPRLEEGLLAARLSATAMIDVSDGLGIDADRLARASGVGLSLDYLPVAPGATAEEALGGGEDYELVFALPPGIDPTRAFADAGARPPIRLGRLSGDPLERRLCGRELPPAGYLHGRQGGGAS